MTYVECPKGKRPYEKRIAQQIVNKRTGKKGHRSKTAGYLRMYHCPACNYWHVTHQERRSGRGKWR